MEASYAASLGRAIEPVIAPLGFNWKIGVGLISSLAAREVIVGTLGTIYGIEGEGNEKGLEAALRQDLNLASAVSEPRLHSQLWPDVIGFEQGLSPDTQRQLEAMGHALAPARAMGATNAVEQLASPPSEPRGSLGVSDPRRSAGPAMGE